MYALDVSLSNSLRTRVSLHVVLKFDLQVYVCACGLPCMYAVDVSLSDSLRTRVSLHAQVKFMHCDSCFKSALGVAMNCTCLDYSGRWIF